MGSSGLLVDMQIFQRKQEVREGSNGAHVQLIVRVSNQGAVGEPNIVDPLTLLLEGRTSHQIRADVTPVDTAHLLSSFVDGVLQLYQRRLASRRRLQ